MTPAPAPILTAQAHRAGEASELRFAPAREDALTFLEKSWDSAFWKPMDALEIRKKAGDPKVRLRLRGRYEVRAALAQVRRPRTEERNPSAKEPPERDSRRGPSIPSICRLRALVGAPGVLIAIILMFTIKEPPRGYSDPPSAKGNGKAPFFDAFREFSAKPTFWWLSLGAALVAFVGYGLISFQAPFLQRVHGIDVRDAAVLYGAPLAAVAALGTFLGGYISEKLAGRFSTISAWLPGVGLLIAVPAYVGAFFAPTIEIAFGLWIIAGTMHYAYLSSQYMVGTAIVSPQSRATTIAVLLLIVSLIGNGIGPLFVGAMSDFFMGQEIGKAGLSAFADAFNPRLCGTDPAALGAEGPELCRAYANGLRHSMAATVLFFIVAAFCYFMASRSFMRDRYNPDSPAADMNS